MARRAASEQIIRAFFSAPVPRSLFPESASKKFQPLSEAEMEKLGRLAGLQVSNRSKEFRTSVAQVLDFCAAIQKTQSELPPPSVSFEEEVPFEPPDSDSFVEQVTEGGHADLLLRNASKTQEGLFVAPATRPSSS